MKQYFIIAVPLLLIALCGCPEPSCVDADGDGFYESCNRTLLDCDDTDPSTYPGANEVCGDSKDNDCDNDVDEGCPCQTGDSRECGVSNIGECEFGTQACVDGVWGSCTGSIGPVTEICNDSKDNDCDGEVDEGCVSEQNPIDFLKEYVLEEGWVRTEEPPTTTGDLETTIIFSNDEWLCQYHMMHGGGTGTAEFSFVFWKEGNVPTAVIPGLGPFEVFYTPHYTVYASSPCTETELPNFIQGIVDELKKLETPIALLEYYSFGDGWERNIGTSFPDLEAYKWNGNIATIVLEHNELICQNFVMPGIDPEAKWVFSFYEKGTAPEGFIRGLSPVKEYSFNDMDLLVFTLCGDAEPPYVISSVYSHLDAMAGILQMEEIESFREYSLEESWVREETTPLSSDILAVIKFSSDEVICKEVVMFGFPQTEDYANYEFAFYNKGYFDSVPVPCGMDWTRQQLFQSENYDVLLQCNCAEDVDFMKDLIAILGDPLLSC
ncbi:MAG: putative metal-binding motif-containing protein [Candidatus Diapherotrites archaeon]|nr:putative metal-binding motif-containing protein [Candidatus Diapherotrites archaeon]